MNNIVLAAPDMYEALKELLKHHDNIVCKYGGMNVHIPEEECYKKARKALAKAEGK